jgi:hypothetical protein
MIKDKVYNRIGRISGKGSGNFPGKVDWKKVLIAIILVISILPGCSRESTEPGPRSNDIFDRLRSLTGLTVTEISPYYGYPRAFRIDITQPVDHNNPGGQQFQQRMYLSHVNESMPMVFAPSGYQVSELSGQEIAGILQTNCLNVTHRYLDDAKPNPLDWRYLTIQQAAADHHRIVTIMKTIYTGPWVSSGASKSGMTPLFHKYFYSDDVRAVIAYVSPFMFSTSDERFPIYLASIGTGEDWTLIHDFQRRMLMNRDVMVDLFVRWFQDRGYTISGNVESRFEGAVQGYDWNFYQRHIYNTSQIPGTEATPESMLAHLAEVIRMESESDEGNEFYKPWIYQAFTQIGYPARHYNHLMDLLQYEPIDPGEWFSQEEGVELVYDPSLMQDIYNWIRTEGNNIIFIYGSDDPWTGGAVELTGETNAIRIIREGEDHGVGISDLLEPDRQLVLAKIEEWLGIQIPPSYQQGIRIPLKREIRELTIRK